MDAMTVQDLDFAVGSTNLGGTRGKVQYVPATHIKTWPEYDADGITLSTPPVLETGKRWADIYTTKDTSSVEDKEVGELDGGSWETDLEFFHPKVRAELLTLKMIFTNGPFVLVVTDGNGVKRVVGSKDLPAYRTPGTISGGKTAKDRNGASFKFTASGDRPAPICAFPISLAPAV